MRIIAIVLLLFSLLACESLVTQVNPKNLDIPGSKLTVSCFLNPSDEHIEVYVSRSSPLFETVELGELRNAYDINFFNDLFVIPDATVSLVNLTNPSENIIIPFNEEKRAYVVESGFPTIILRANDVYELTVTKGDEIVKATTTIPRRQDDYTILIPEITEDFFFAPETDTIFFSLANLRITWGYDKEDDSYFRVRAVVNSNGINENEKVEVFKSSVFFGESGIFDGSNPVSSTAPTIQGIGRIFKETNRSSSKINPETNELEFQQSFLRDVTPFAVDYEVMTLSQEYFEFYNSVNRYQNTTDNPFIEPTPIYSNIEGGLGIFAGANSRFRRFFLEQGVNP